MKSLAECETLRSGMSMHEFLALLKNGTELIRQVANRLNFPQKTIISAQKYLVQYCYKNSAAIYPWEDISIACLFVSSKVNDTCKKIRFLLLAAFLLKAPEFEGKEFNEEATIESFRKQIIGYERLVLEAIDFSFSPERTFESLVKFAKYFGVEDGVQLGEAWGFIERAYTTPLCVEYANEIVALYALYAKVPSLRGDLEAFAGSYLRLPGAVWKEVQAESVFFELE